VPFTKYLSEIEQIIQGFLSSAHPLSGPSSLLTERTKSTKDFVSFGF